MNNKMRLLHTMIRVKNLEESINFYTTILGMKINKQKDYPDGKFTLVFLGYNDIDKDAQVELTYNWGVEHYEIGTAFGHLAIGVENIYNFCDMAKKHGVKVVREPAEMKFGGSVIAFIEDPNGYKIELIQL